MGYVARLLSDDERILIVAREHWLFLLGHLIRSVLIIAVILAINLVTLFRYHVPSLQPYLSLVLFLALLWPLVSVILSFLRWNHELYLVTNLRVMKVEGVLGKNVLDSSLDKVNDVSLRQSLLGRMLGYGDIEILTAAEAAINLLDHIAQPVEFKRTMMAARTSLDGLQRIRRRPEGEEEEERAATRDDELLASLTQLRDSGLLDEAEYQRKRQRLQRKGQ